MVSKRILVAGVGNVFLGDDGFGVEVAKRLEERELPEGVEVGDFGIRGMDLVYALQEGYEAIIFVDAVPRGGEPGTVYLIEPRIEEEGEVVLDAHGMDPVRVMRLARAMGAPPARVLVVGCEPEKVMGEEDPEEMAMGLSEPVEAALREAVEMVEALTRELVYGENVRRGGER
ncbi:MAG: hydrogenase maturation protease [Rubrobacteraceae bacterium]|nr:hydrogenase maturation protease [Rubrobacteraceae bacterium]MCL6438519.1 hydrogenase maturation protease [Rubrobacteraceae bacterium]